jgi:pimeloyl-ACP methyl ester carboxylesterase
MQTQTTTSKDGTAIAYDVQGSGPPLVLVHGAMGSRNFGFAQKTAVAFAPHFTVYNVDRRGRNESGDTLPYSIAKEVDDIAAVCKAAGGKPYVLGSSSGAALALEAAASGVPMAGLFAYEPPFVRADPSDHTDGAAYQASLEALVAKDDRAGAVALFMRTVGVPGFIVAIMRLMPMWKTAKANAHTLPYDARVMGDFQVPAARLAKIQVPTAIGYGTKTPARLRLAAEAAAHATPKGRLVPVPKASHSGAPKFLVPVVVESLLKP